MKLYVRRMLFCIAILLSVTCAFTACYYCETTEPEEYVAFYNQMKNANTQLDVFLPPLENDDPIDDMYLFYNGRDLIDTYHTVYLNCHYTEEVYHQEKERMVQFCNDENLLIKDSNSFDMPSLMYGEGFFGDTTSMILDYTYVLFDEAELRIIYITFFDKEINGEYTNIPEEYLPKELINLDD